MSQNNEKDPVYPQGYGHVQERIDATMGRLDQIDKQIETTPHDKGLALTLNPPGSFQSRPLGNRAQRIDFLKDQKDRIKTDAWEKTEADTRNADNKSGRVVRDHARETLFPNPYRQMTPEKKSGERENFKDIEASQDYMDATLVEWKDAQKEVNTQDKTPDDQQAKTGMSMSERFSTSLGYTKISEKTERTITSSRDRQPDQDRD